MYLIVMYTYHIWKLTSLKRRHYEIPRFFKLVFYIFFGISHIFHGVSFLIFTYWGCHTNYYKDCIAWTFRKFLSLIRAYKLFSIPQIFLNIKWYQYRTKSIILNIFECKIFCKKFIRKKSLLGLLCYQTFMINIVYSFWEFTYIILMVFYSIVRSTSKQKVRQKYQKVLCLIQYMRTLI